MFEQLGIGVGLRTTHYRTILAEHPPVDWFEIISENFLHTEGRPMAVLEDIAAHYPVVMHGVSLSIGSTDPLDVEHVRALARLRDRVGARWVSDHLCWTGVRGHNSHDLLPMPLTREALDHVAERVHAVQDLLGAPLVLENPSTYVQFVADEMPEWDFLGALCDRTDCRLLLDVNNVYVSSRNHGYDPQRYLDAIDVARVVQFHVAGHSDHGDYVIDTHIGPVIDPVWALLRYAWRRGARASILLEWDAEIPSFEEVHADALRARAWLGEAE